MSFRVYDPVCGSLDFCPHNARCQDNNMVECPLSQMLNTSLDYPKCVTDVFKSCDQMYHNRYTNEACHAGAIQSARQPWLLPATSTDDHSNEALSISRYFPLSYAVGLSQWLRSPDRPDRAIASCDAMFKGVSENEACHTGVAQAQKDAAILKEGGASSGLSTDIILSYASGMTQGGQKCTVNRSNQ
jgi:hypothetical protein